MKRLIFWDFPRASWQYDVAVALILAFIFLIPRSLFKDQPRPASIVQMPSEHRGNIYWLETALLEGVGEGARAAQASRYLSTRYGRKLEVEKVESIQDEEGEIRGYMAVVKQ